MRKPKQTLMRFLFVLLGICVLWCLSLPYFILSKVNPEGMSVTSDHRLMKKSQVWVETSEAQDVVKIFARFVDELLSVVESSKNFSSPPRLKDYKEELHVLQVKMEAEKAKGQQREELISELRSDKVQLRRQLTQMEELLKLQMEKRQDQKREVKQGTGTFLKERSLEAIYRKSNQEELEDKNCPLLPTDGFPECKGKLKWMKDMWKSDPCYSSYGVNGSLCSFIIYLSEVESWCPVLSGRERPPAAGETPGAGRAVLRHSLEGLYQTLGDKSQFTWIQQRIKSMEGIWVEAGRSLSAKHNLTESKAQQILVHPGLVTQEANLKIVENAFSGGPLGELVQWSDLIATVYTLGHDLHLSASKQDLKTFFDPLISNCPSRQPKVEPDLIYTDIIGFRQIQSVLKSFWTKYKCVIRVLDSFGTEPDFNHELWAKNHNLRSPFGGLNLSPLQFYTMFPHTPDNTFLGFVVQHQLSSEEHEQLRSTTRQNQALVYGKRASFWRGKDAYLDVIHKYMDVHGTVDDGTFLPSYVKNHGIVKGTEVQTLLRQSKVFVGLSFPYEGPAPLEALANGCIFLNPRLNPPQSSLNSEFFKGKPNTREVTSQHPYAEAIGEPYVWVVDMSNQTDVHRALTAILNHSIDPYLPYEFTCEGMLQRVNVLIEKQDFCSDAKSWPPLSALQVLKANAGVSCKQACQGEGLICEPMFFPHLNDAKNLASYSVDCQTSESSNAHIVLPAYDSSRKRCLLQSDPLLFSCVRSDPSFIRICPCRDYIKDQIALCKTCI
ncbi:alpha-1,6-mannosylglycoprotein 6-beta-N-acetylglucosaminyltransferase A [Austrofundulus limnaeus]|uniref:alpha-1,6-mannosyl-glycoprotein 6-beta-N-acetylglucosaminyltransferase n=1 Tax=Austrofundulus limnaeus TaxID=52670 RepID=A0A2I4CK04_AUSLI|nr:PREDICTED: alpha-1,6-mannosylglycoprotein 6-beta-N-acetylglucosaminyltransferase A-like [Austrofundulus limnaeus]